MPIDVIERKLPDRPAQPGVAPERRAVSRQEATSPRLVGGEEATQPRHVVVQLLGGFRVVVDGSAVGHGAWHHRRAAELVKLLALAPGHRLHREQVADALWPGLGRDAALANLHKAAHHARATLGARQAVVLRAGLVALWPDADVETDVQRFERAAADALAHDDPSACAAAAARCTGELLPADPYAEWALAARERQRLRRLQLLRRAARWEEVVEIDPTDEQAHRELMRAYAAAGNRHAALRQFRRLRDVLRRELGLRPDAETMAVFEAVAAGGEVAAEAPGDWPLIAREAEMQRLEDAWRRAAEGAASALLVSGGAGIGKTRLCEELVADAEEQGWTVLRAAAGGKGSSVADLVVAGGAEGTLVFLDDAHVAEDATVRVLQHLTRRPAVGAVGRPEGGRGVRPLLVVLAFREPAPRSALADAREVLLAQRIATEVQVGPLTRLGVGAMITAVAGRPVTDSETDEVHRLTAGNPFATELLGAQLGAYGTLRLSDSAAKALVARLAGFGPALVAALERAAVCGPEVSADAFSAVSGLPQSEALATLVTALQGGVLQVSGDAYRFTHELLRQALERRVPPQRRAALRRQAASRPVLEAVGPSHLPDRAVA